MKMVSREYKILKQTWFVSIAVVFISIIIIPSTSHALIIGLDARNGMYDLTIFATGDEYDTFRATITALGRTIVPVSSFETENLVRLDSLMMKQPFSEENLAGFSDSEIFGIHAFVDSGGGLAFLRKRRKP